MSARKQIRLQHFSGNLDSWDPALIDAMASAAPTFDTAESAPPQDRAVGGDQCGDVVLDVFLGDDAPRLSPGTRSSFGVEG